MADLSPPTDTSTAIRVVMAEDHLLTRIGIRATIARAGDISVVGEAENGEEAVRLVDAMLPDVVLMDVGMPVMDGIQAAKEILARHSNVRVVMLTSHDNENDILAALASGASGYCTKDIEPARLYAAIRSVHAGDIWLDAAIADKALKRYVQQGRPAAAASSAIGVQEKPERHKLERGTLSEPLSARESEVMALIVDGLSNQEIADKLIVSLATVKTHVRSILNKLAVDDRTQAAVAAMRRGIV